jgi:alpha-galactosidase
VRFVGVLLAVVLAALLPGSQVASGSLDRGYNGLAATPPMGWNDYNAYGLDVTETLIRRTADAMVSTGLRDAGYVYLNIDDGWQAGTRDSHGDLRADATRFPSGIAAVAGYVHSLGLKIGIYSDAGLKTCGGLPGSLGHETADAALFAAWGIDYVKYDNCYAGPGCDQVGCPDGTAAPAQDRYARMRDALVATGRPIVFSICNWGTEGVSRWAAGYGNLWRTTGDILPTYASLLSIFQQTVAVSGYAGPYGWNDPDMLQIGNGMSATEDRTELTLWAMLAAPLIIGTDLTAATPATLALLTNAAVIAVDQDPLGRAATVVSAAGGRYVLTRPLADGDVAVALFNSADTAATITADAPAGTRTDLWTGATTTGTGPIQAVVPAHGVQLYRIGS